MQYIIIHRLVVSLLLRNVFLYTEDDVAVSSSSLYLSRMLANSVSYVFLMSSTLRAPVMTILPDLNMRNTNFGFLHLNIRPGNKSGVKETYAPNSLAMSCSFIGNPAAALATIFCIRNLRNMTGIFSCWNMRVYFLAASLESSVLLHPVTTMFPDAKMSAVDLGFSIRMVVAANVCGLYSQHLYNWDSCFKSI